MTKTLVMPRSEEEHIRIELFMRKQVFAVVVGSNNNNPNPPSLAYDHGTHVAGIAEIGMINAKEENNTKIEYQFQNKRTASAYYRLRILDKVRIRLYALYTSCVKIGKFVKI